jgi:hypothetical protein
MTKKKRIFIDILFPSLNAWISSAFTDCSMINRVILDEIILLNMNKEIGRKLTE